MTSEKPIDIRIKQLSYSALLTLHTCPRKFQLNRLGSRGDETGDAMGALTFAFGHSVGEGIQFLMEGMSLEDTVFKMFLNWEVDLLEFNPKQKKSFWLAVNAVRQFEHIYKCDVGRLAGYKLMYLDEERTMPAVELGFAVEFPDGFLYRGKLDAALMHEDTGEVLVLESKTDSGNSGNPTKYKNSAQAIGYSVVLDVLVPELSSYKVLYMSYMTKLMEWEQYEFTKSLYERALWIQETLLDVEMLRLYERAEVYPKHGENCFDWHRDCEYLSTCTLSTRNLMVQLTDEIVENVHKKNEEYLIKLDWKDLLTSQYERG